MTDFKRHIVTFLLLHLTLAVLLGLGFKLFTDLTIEIFAYLFRFTIVFGLFTTLVQSLVFTFITINIRLAKVWSFFVALIIELLLVNILVVYANGGDSFTGDLIYDVKYHNTWSNLAGSFIIHMGILIATLATILTRPIYSTKSP